MVLAANVTNKMVFARFHTYIAFTFSYTHARILSVLLVCGTIAISKHLTKQHHSKHAFNNGIDSDSILIRLHSNNTAEAFM